MRKIVDMKTVKILNILLIVIAMSFSSCDSNHLSKTSINQFNGVWELKGRSLFDGIQVEIEVDKSGKVSSKVVQLNDNKYVQLFLSEGDEWVRSIKRSSNFEFVISELKLAAPLFALYGNSTTKEWNVVFKNKDCFGISENKNPERSSIEYCRVK